MKPKSVPTTKFGQALRQIRERHGLSQGKLADRLELAGHTIISRWESGSRLPSRDSVDQLVRAMPVSKTERNRLYEAAGFLPDWTPELED